MEGGKRNKKETWLTEDALTDDDLPLMDQSTEDLTTTSQGSDSAIHSLTDFRKDNTSSISQTLSMMTEHNIKTLLVDNATKGDISKIKANIDELDEFLTKNDGFRDEGNYMEMNVPEDNEAPSQNDNGNDTDELLRMLGEDNDKKRKVYIKTVKKSKMLDNDDSTEDELEAAIKTYKIPKTKQNEQPVKPEKYKNNKSTVKKPTTKPRESETKSPKNKLSKTSVTKTYSPPVKVKNYSFNIAETRKTAPFKTYVPKHRQTASNAKVERAKVEDKEDKEVSSDEDIKEEEFLDEECFDLDDDIGNCGEVEESDEELEKQTRRIPEKMEEEVPSDQESRDSELSLYGELPSTDSSDVDEWFELDLRNEMAAEYLPLLGSQPEDLLMKEKERVKHTITNLKQRLESIVTDMDVQMGKIADERLKLIEIDSLLHEK